MHIVFQVLDHLEWWHVLPIISAVGFAAGLANGVSLFSKAIVAILVVKLLRPEIAKLVLSLIFEGRKPQDVSKAR